jgi:hypothetical protein
MCMLGFIAINMLKNANTLQEFIWVERHPILLYALMGTP